MVANLRDLIKVAPRLPKELATTARNAALHRGLASLLPLVLIAVVAILPLLRPALFASAR